MELLVEFSNVIVHLNSYILFQFSFYYYLFLLILFLFLFYFIFVSFYIDEEIYDYGHMMCHVIDPEH